MPSTDSILKQLTTVVNEGAVFSPFVRLLLVGLVIWCILERRVLATYIAAYVGLVIMAAGMMAIGFPMDIFTFLVLFSIGLLWGREALLLPPPPRAGRARIAVAAAFALCAVFYPHFVKSVTGFKVLDVILFAPLGMLPSPTLLFAMAAIILTKRAHTLYALVPTWAAGALFGGVGVFYLGVSADWVLLAGTAVSIVSYLTAEKSEPRPKGHRFKRKH